MSYIYSASAGSGKTFNLALNYIAMSMVGDYRSILAVTFTNPSTKEMKERIISMLYDLSQKDDFSIKSSIKPILHDMTGAVITDEYIEKRSMDVLRKIIHGYDFFTVSTIDAFFQRVMKNVSREMGIKSDYEILLEENDYTTKAVKLLLQSPNDKVRKFLEEFFLSLSNEGKTWNIEKELIKFINSNLSKLKTIEGIDLDKSFDIDKLYSFGQQNEKKIAIIKNAIFKCRGEFFALCDKYNLGVDDFKGKSTGIYGAIKKLTEIDKAINSQSAKDGNFLGARYNIDGDYLKNSACPKEIVCKITEIYNLLCSYNEKNIYRHCVFQIGLIGAVQKIKDELKQQDGVFLLNDTGYLLDVLDSGDVEFVYEKISQYVSNVMIDEFQDTNEVSYRNLKKIIDEVAYRGRTYIFGDIKQSIYRWNGGDWRIMSNLIEEKDSHVIDLKDNYRSLGNIVDFNNKFFASTYKEYLSMDITDQTLPDNFHDKKGQGIVRVKFLENKDEMFPMLTKEIDYYHDQKGYAYEDIGILFRSKKDLINSSLLLRDIKDKDYNPISDDAYTFASSPAICMIIEYLKILNDEQCNGINNKKSQINAKSISREIVGEKSSLPYTLKNTASLFDLVTHVAHYLNIDEDNVFLPAFYDKIREFSRRKGADISDFLDFWDSTLQNIKVDISAVKKGVTMTTIHKSKGLAYKVVIIPYCDWKLYESTNLWVDNQAQGENGESLPLFVASSSALRSTRFREYYENEKEMQVVDNINLLYVAFTRARECLSVLSTMADKSKQKNTSVNDVKDVGQILYNFCKNDVEILPLSKGNIKGSDKPYKKTKSLAIDKLNFINKPFTFSSSSIDEIKDWYLEDSVIDPKQRGVILHKMLAESSGNPSDKIVDRVLQQIRSILKSNNYRTINERGIMTEHKDFRPDKVMYNNNEVIVIDYKFGKHREKYSSQVRNYMNLLSQMDIFVSHTIKGYLFYINMNNGEVTTQEVE